VNARLFSWGPDEAMRVGKLSDVWYRAGSALAYNCWAKDIPRALLGLVALGVIDVGVSTLAASTLKGSERESERVILNGWTGGATPEARCAGYKSCQKTDAQAPCRD
jgi:hypothetical protein